MTDSIKPSSAYRIAAEIGEEEVLWPDCRILHESLDKLLEEWEAKFNAYRGDPPEEWVALCRENPRLPTDKEIQERLCNPASSSSPPGFMGSVPLLNFLGFATAYIFILSFVGFSVYLFLGAVHWAPGDTLGQIARRVFDELRYGSGDVRSSLYWALLLLGWALLVVGAVCVLFLWSLGAVLWVLWGLPHFFKEVLYAALSVMDERYGNAWQEKFWDRGRDFRRIAELQSENMRRGVIEMGKGYYPWWEGPSRLLLLSHLNEEVAERVRSFDVRVETLENKRREWGTWSDEGSIRYESLCERLQSVAKHRSDVLARVSELRSVYLERLNSDSHSDDEGKRSAARASVRSLLGSVESAERIVAQEEFECVRGVGNTRSGKIVK